MQYITTRGKPYIDNRTAYDLFNTVLAMCLDNGILDKGEYDVKYEGDQPKGLQKEYTKVLEVKLNKTIGIWLPKEEYKHLVPSNDTKRDSMIMDSTVQHRTDKAFVQHVAKEVVTAFEETRRSQGAASSALKGGGKRKESQKFNTNEKVDYTFPTSTGLQHVTGWKMQVDAKKEKRYFAPDGNRCESLPKVREYIEELENGTAKPPSKRKAPTENTNEI